MGGESVKVRWRHCRPPGALIAAAHVHGLGAALSLCQSSVTGARLRARSKALTSTGPRERPRGHGAGAGGSQRARCCRPGAGAGGRRPIPFRSILLRRPRPSPGQRSRHGVAGTAQAGTAWGPPPRGAPRHHRGRARHGEGHGHRVTLRHFPSGAAVTAIAIELPGRRAARARRRLRRQLPRLVELPGRGIDPRDLCASSSLSLVRSSVVEPVHAVAT
jgi:hypothetical protein